MAPIQFMRTMPTRRIFGRSYTTVARRPPVHSIVSNPQVVFLQPIFYHDVFIINFIDLMVSYVSCNFLPHEYKIHDSIKNLNLVAKKQHEDSIMEDLCGKFRIGRHCGKLVSGTIKSMK